MTTISTHHHHHLNLDLPPRKLFLNHDSMKFEETLLRKFLPYNGGDDDDTDPYASDHFRMFEFKVRRCTRSRSHDWTDCPFAHPGEKARRRDPRRFHYSGTVCSEYRRGGCSRGDNCEFAHGVFECWLHPARYRTEACKDGRNCSRKVCFFAHTARELRVLPVQSPKISPENSSDKKYKISGSGAGCSSNHCCMYCHCLKNASPTSALSPGFSPITRYRDRVLNSENYSSSVSYNEALNELMNSLEAMNMNEDQEQMVGSPLSRNFLGFTSGKNCYKGNDNNGWNCSDPDIGWVDDLLM